MAVAVGDYDAAEQLGPVIRPQLAALYDEVDTSVGEFAPDAVYARLVVGGALARVSLVSHAFVDAARYGAGARSDARWLEAHDPGSGRADFFFGLYELYTGIAPFWLRAAGVLAGVHGDPARGRLLLERVVRDNGAFAPEAARVLLEEVPASHRPTCRYLSLAVDLARLYPRNGRFQWYVDREFARCEDLAEYPALDAPRLKGGCGAAADLAQANGAPGGWPPYSP
jgi:hypothetical protein